MGEMASSQPSRFGISAPGTFVTNPVKGDPYCYQGGFGNRFASEAIPETLPIGRNTPQKCKYDLYSEQLNGSSFVASRSAIQHVWFYRIRPAAAHNGVTKLPSRGDIESNFTSSNASVEFVPQSLCWSPFTIPKTTSHSIDFVDGLRTIAGSGDPTTKEGLAIHIYTANASMSNRAFCSNDGDMLIIPQEGRLDIQTEFGKLMVKPGEFIVVQAGMRLTVNLPDGPSRGYIQEIFGSHYELAELGPLGSNGMASPRDFETPVASFDIDSTPWEVVYKLAGNLFSCKQNHTPFDVVAWHGNYVPYKYDTSKFIASAVVDRDQSDPTIYTILTAKSKVPGVSITEVVFFGPKWNVADSFRPPYYHRNMSTEIMGLVYGSYGGSSKNLQPGGLSFQSSYMPHGETYPTWQQATTASLTPERVGEGSLSFMLHISAHCAVTRYAMEKSGVLQESNPNLWNDMKGHFEDHIEEIERLLTERGMGRGGLLVSSRDGD